MKTGLVYDSCFCNACGELVEVSRGISLGTYRSPHGHPVNFRLLFCRRCFFNKSVVESTVQRYMPVFERAARYSSQYAPETGYKEVSRIQRGDVTYRLLKGKGYETKVQERRPGWLSWKNVNPDDSDYERILTELKDAR